MANRVAPEGTIIEMQDGSRQIKRGGAWVSLGNINPTAAGAAYMGDNGGAPKLPKDDATAIKTARESATDANRMALDAGRFLDFNYEVPTGGIENFGPIGAVTKFLDPRKQEMEAIAKRLVPQQRVPGSGPFTDADAKLEAEAGLSLNKYGNANRSTAFVMQAGAKRRADYSAFLEYWARRNGSILGATEAWDAYADANRLYDVGKEGTIVRQTTPWREWFGVGSVGGGKPTAPPAGRPTGKPIDALRPGGKVVANGGRPMSPQEAMRLPKGARFVGIDGIERTVQ
jgi:hypothetical protein